MRHEMMGRRLFKASIIGYVSAAASFVAGGIIAHAHNSVSDALIYMGAALLVLSVVATFGYIYLTVLQFSVALHQCHRDMESGGYDD